MEESQTQAPAHRGYEDVDSIPARMAHSATSERPVLRLSTFREELRRQKDTMRMGVKRVRLDHLTGWQSGQTADITHVSGRFFSITGLRVRYPNAPIQEWCQPIIDQPEIGILGILVKEINGVMHCLMQLKIEPGNRHGLQLAPTVQATHSNYSGVHGGHPVPYLEHFSGCRPEDRIADVLQSEQGAWFCEKRNRNMIVETGNDITVLDGFYWFTFGQLLRLLEFPDLLNMDARSVLSCMPFAGPYLRSHVSNVPGSFTDCLVRSLSGDDEPKHTLDEIDCWLHAVHGQASASAELISLAEVTEWRSRKGTIRHTGGNFFQIIGISVSATSREVAHWCQPILRPCGTGLVAFLVTRRDGVLHVLTRAKVERGCVERAELGPTVQCNIENYGALPPSCYPAFLEEVLEAAPENVRFANELAEEGGRFYHAMNHYKIVETDRVFEHPDFRWLTVHQLSELVRRGQHVNVQARSLLCCLYSLTTRPPWD